MCERERERKTDRQTYRQIERQTENRYRVREIEKRGKRKSEMDKKL